MITLTDDECKRWAQGSGALDEDNQLPLTPPGYHTVSAGLPSSFTRLTWFSRFIEKTLQPWDQCLLWVINTGIWPSSENWHLYYRLRQSYGDNRILESVPGHLFLQYETHDLVSFIQVAILSGWDFHLLTRLGYAHAFVSHDEWIELYFSTEEEKEKVVKELTEAQIKLLP